ncbi:MAG: hypothetical protein H6738_14960 [Alphaproteobacteria bacterium]|nr:hypothetical protein [Alphaproteobacteria bacterium]MCB9698077.1 hypothetical protein [Alphaproteobacteria bacterium]
MVWRRSPLLLLSAVLGGCPWIGSEAFDARLDADGDGLVAAELGGADCDDTDPVRGAAPTWYEDGDGDGYGADEGETLVACDPPDGWAASVGDCDDGDPARFPGAEERCNGLDDDCDGLGDPEDAPGGPTWYLDADGDGYGDPAQTEVACGAPSHFVDRAGDCDDGDPDLNPETVWHLDDDHDGYGGDETVTGCEEPPWSTASGTDCDDADPDVNPAAQERCDPDDVDEDCDGDADDLDPDAIGQIAWTEDGDGDGYGVDGTEVSACDPPTASSVAQGGDCDDLAFAVHPNAAERCDEVDSDCDLDLDDPDASGRLPLYADTDGDGWGSGAPIGDGCFETANAVFGTGDCRPGDPSFHPGAADTCYDGADQDCAGNDDDDCDGDGFVADFRGGDDCDDDDPLVYPGSAPAVREVPGTYATIQAAVDAACDGDVVEVDAGTWVGAVTIDRAIDVRGAGPGVTVIDAQGSGPTLSVTTARLSSLSLVNGSNLGNGGCLVVTAAAIVEDVTIADCFGAIGGGVFVAPYASLVMTDTEILRSSSGMGGGMMGSVGSTLSLERVLFEDDVATSAGGLGISVGLLDMHDVVFRRTTASTGGAMMALTVGGTWERVTLDGVGGAGFPGIYANNVAGLTIRDLLAVDGRGEVSSQGTAMFLDQVHDAVIERVRVEGGVGGWGVGANASSVRVGVSAGTATVSDVQLVRAPGQLDLVTGLASDRLTVRNVTVVQSATAGLRATANTGAIDVADAVLVDNAGAGLSAVGNGVTLTRADVVGNAGGDLVGPVVATDVLAVDPGFRSLGPAVPDALVDLRPGPGSPLIDAGDPTTSDPDGSRTDLGGYGGPAADPLWWEDLDADGMLDDVERWFGLDPSVDDSALDPDGDGLTNLQEFQLGTFPDTSDTDGDGLSDRAEALGGSDPLDGASP